MKTGPGAKSLRLRSSDLSWIAACFRGKSKGRQGRDDFPRGRQYRGYVGSQAGCTAAGIVGGQRPQDGNLFLPRGRAVLIVVEEDLRPRADRCARVERKLNRQTCPPQIGRAIDLHKSKVGSVIGGDNSISESNRGPSGFWMQDRAGRIVVDSQRIKTAFGRRD